MSTLLPRSQLDLDGSDFPLKQSVLEGTAIVAKDAVDAYSMEKDALRGHHFTLSINLPREAMWVRLTRRLAQDFIKQTSTPFFIEIATFAPHSPYRPAYRDERAYPDAVVPRTPAYDARPGATAPDWLKDIPVLPQFEKDAIDDQFRLRTQSVLAIDKMISDIRATLRAVGKDRNTYIFFSSDNGYHMGDYSLLPGKMTPFDTDIKVPLVVIGPGVMKQEVKQIAQNIDLSNVHRPRRPECANGAGWPEPGAAAAWTEPAGVAKHGAGRTSWPAR